MKNKIFDAERDYTEIVHEFYTIVPGKKELKVYGKVEKVTTGDHIQYWGKLSHYYLFKKESQEYIGEEDSIYGSVETVTERVRQHLEHFTAEFGVLENKRYN